MSRKRVAPICLCSRKTDAPNIEIYQYEYYRPGCYYIPQVMHEVKPYNCTFLNHWQPCCSTATYVVDAFGTANYPSDLEYQLHVPTSMYPPRRELMYNYYDTGEAEISSLPQIQEDDFDEDAILQKRKRLKVENEFESEASKPSKNSCRPNIYRTNEGYLVEEPNDNAAESV